jgi:phospholipid/cholesterol/gamma-HCH transport system substrate-binding protein
MKKDPNAFLAGLFILVAAGLVIVILISIEGSAQFLEPEHSLAARFTLADNIGGLSVGDEVRVGGAKVGAVRSIGFDRSGQGDPTIVVRFTMPRHFIVRSDAKISIESGLTGVSVLNFQTLGTKDELPEGTALAGSPSSLQSLMASLGELGPEAVNTVKDVRSGTIPKLNKVLDHANVISSSLADVLGPGKGETELKETIDDVHAIADSARGRVPELLARLDDAAEKLNTVLEQTRGTLVDLKQVAANAKVFSASARSILTDNRSRIDRIILSLKETGENLKGASAEIRRSPWRLLYRPAPNEMANLNLYDAAREFADGASALQDSATALRDASEDPAVDPQKLKAMMAQLQTAFNTFRAAEDKFWDSVKQ